MTAEELNAIENLSNELKVFNKRMKVFSLLKYIEIRYANDPTSKSVDISIRKRIDDGLKFLADVEEKA